MKIIHTADWQLAKPCGRFSSDVSATLSEARLDVIDRVATVASDRGAAYVVVAGDVFDKVDAGDRIEMQALSHMERANAKW
jgi:DNA repair exonuclease SbcCD nuclease subunit